MPARTESREIGGRKYTVTQMPPTESVPIQVELLAIASSVIGPMLKQSEGTEAALSGALQALGTTIHAHMPPDKFLGLAKKLTESGHVRTEEGPLIFEQEFMGDAGANLYPLIGFILEVNYAKFFTALGLGRVADLAKARFGSPISSESPQT